MGMCNDSVDLLASFVFIFILTSQIQIFTTYIIEIQPIRSTNVNKTLLRCLLNSNKVGQTLHDVPVILGHSK